MRNISFDKIGSWILLILAIFLFTYTKAFAFSAEVKTSTQVIEVRLLQAESLTFTSINKITRLGPSGTYLRIDSAPISDNTNTWRLSGPATISMGLAVPSVIADNRIITPEVVINNATDFRIRFTYSFSESTTLRAEGEVIASFSKNTATPATFTVRGRIMYPGTPSRPAGGASVSIFLSDQTTKIADTSSSTTASNLGAYSVANLTPRSYTAIALKEGYDTGSTNFTITTQDLNDVNIYLRQRDTPPPPAADEFTIITKEQASEVSVPGVTLTATGGLFSDRGIGSTDSRGSLTVKRSDIERYANLKARRSYYDERLESIAGILLSGSRISTIYLNISKPTFDRFSGAVTNGYNQIKLQWYNNTYPEARFELVRMNESWVEEKTIQIPSGTTKYTDNEVVSKKQYRYKIRALVDRDGNKVAVSDYDTSSLVTTPEQKFRVSGQIRDSEGKPIAMASAIIVAVNPTKLDCFDNQGNLLNDIECGGTVSTDAGGSYSMEILQGRTYILTANKEGVLFKGNNFSIRATNKDTTQDFIVLGVPIEASVEAVQTVEGCDLILNKNTMFRVYLWTNENLPDGMKLDSLRVQVYAKKVGQGDFAALGGAYTVTGYSYRVDGKTLILPNKINNTQGAYDNTRRKGLDAVQFCDGINGTPYKPDKEGRLEIKARVFRGNAQIKETLASWYTVYDQKETLNIGWVVLELDELPKFQPNLYRLRGLPINPDYNQLRSWFASKIPNIRNRIADMFPLAGPEKIHLIPLPLEMILAPYARSQCNSLVRSITYYSDSAPEWEREQARERNKCIKDEICKILSISAYDGLKRYNDSLPNDKKIDRLMVIPVRPYFGIGRSAYSVAGLTFDPVIFFVSPRAITGDETSIEHEIAHTYDLSHPMESAKVFHEKEVNPNKDKYLAAKGWSFLYKTRKDNLSPSLEGEFIGMDLGYVAFQDMDRLNNWDFMSYWGPTWINIGNYNELMRIFREERGGFEDTSWMSGGHRSSYERYLLLTGYANRDGTGFTLTQPTIVKSLVTSPLTGEGGAFKIQGFDANGVAITDARVVFGLIFSDAAEVSRNLTPLPKGRFYVSLPYTSALSSIQAYYNNNPIRINFNGQSLDSLTRALNNSVLTTPLRIYDNINSDPKRFRVSFAASDATRSNNLAYSIYYRRQDNSAWIPLIQQQPYVDVLGGIVHDFNKDNLPGGTNGKIKVVLSSGLNEVEFESSDPLAVPLKDPNILILAPNANAIFSKGDSIGFEAYGLDADNNELTADSCFSWTAVKEDNPAAPIALGQGRKITKNTLNIPGRYLVTVKYTPSGRTRSEYVSLPVPIEIDDLNNPDAAIIDVILEPETLDLDSQNITAEVAILNVRKDTFANLKVSGSNAGEIATFESIRLPANEITTIPVTLEKEVLQNTPLDIVFELTDIENELITENNTYTIRYPLPTNTLPEIEKIILYPADFVGKDERLHVAVKVKHLAGEEILEYRWRLDRGDVMPNNNKPTFALDLNNLAAGRNYTLDLRVVDVRGNGATASVTFKLVESAFRLDNLAPGWQLISVPAMPVNSSLNSAFEGLTANDFNTGFYRYKGMYYPTTEIKPEEGYFMYLNGGRSLRAALNPLTQDYYDIILDIGWNLIGQPIKRIIALGEISVINRSETKQFADAITASNQWLYPEFWYYDNAQGSYKNETESVKPGRGYWVYSAVDGLKLRFPKNITRGNKAVTVQTQAAMRNTSTLLRNASIADGVLTLTGDNFGPQQDTLKVILESTNGKYNYNIQVAGGKKTNVKAEVDAIGIADGRYNIRLVRIAGQLTMESNILQKQLTHPKGHIIGVARINNCYWTVGSWFGMWWWYWTCNYVPVGDAIVSIVELGRTVKTDTNGNYIFSNVPAGCYTIEISKTNMNSQRNVNFWVRSNQFNQADFSW